MSEIRTVEDLKTVCPMLLYNFELGFCEIDDEKKQLNQEQSKFGHYKIEQEDLVYKAIFKFFIIILNWK